MIKTPPLLNVNALKLCFIAMILNLGLLFFLGGRSLTLNSVMSPDLGYSLYKHGSAYINSARQHAARNKFDRSRFPSYFKIDKQNLYQEAHEKFPVIRTLAYGVLIAGVWLLTGSLELFNVQVLQVFLYILLMLLIFQISFMLFESEQIAYYCSLAHLGFLPLIVLNLQVLNDIWAYYAIVIFVYGYLKFLTRRASFGLLCVTSSCAALFQHIRPTVFFQIMSLALILLIAVALNSLPLSKALLGAGLIMITNIVFFWAPFMAFNKNYYGQYIVGPRGQALMEGGLGDYEDNPWGHRHNDAWFADYMMQNHGLKYGTPECDAKAAEIFFQKVQEHPWFYISSVFKRFLSCLFPQFSEEYLPMMPTTFRYRLSQWLNVEGVGTKIISLTQLLPFKWLSSVMYRRIIEPAVYLFFWLGILLGLRRRSYLQLLVLLGGVILPTFPIILSHIEYRYLMPYYWPVSILAGYFVWHVKDYYLQHGLRFFSIASLSNCFRYLYAKG